ncbi:cyclase family protein [Bacillaceae bacterium]
MVKVYDISAPIFEGMPVYKNKAEKQPQIEIVRDFATGNVRESRIHLDCHTGTHVDAPLHMIENGETIESIPLEDLVGPCKVFDLTEVNGGITSEHLKPLSIAKDDFVLFKTRNSFVDEFDFAFVYLQEDGARYLAEIGVKGVGIDALGVERSQPGHPTHRTLFAERIIIIEGLRLKDVPAGEYFLVAAPLKLIGTEAAPARVLLLERFLFK